MEQIKDLLPKAGETLERPTKVNPRSTEAWGKFHQFECLGDPQLERMKTEAASFLDDLMNNRAPRWISFLGTSGAGKTMLSSVIWRYFRDHLHTQINWPASKLTQTPNTPYGEIIRYRGGFINWGNAINNRMLQGEYGFLEDLRSYSFFVLDDIAAEYERHRELSASKLYNVLEARLRKWTVITANLSLEQIGSRLDARIASRMLRDNGVVIDVDVPDFNLRAKSFCPENEEAGAPLLNPRAVSEPRSAFQEVKKIMQGES